MNNQQLLERVLNGRFVLVGEFRNGRVQTSDTFDKASGEKIQKHEIVYAVECVVTFGSVLIFRDLAADVDLDKVEIGLIRGRRYAFELDRFTRNSSGVIARISFRDLELLD